MSEKGPHIRYFNMGQWPVYVGFSSSPKAFEREMKRINIKGCSFLNSTHANATTHFLTCDDGLTCIIALGDTKDRSKEQVAALIAHEAMHVVQEMWSHLGETNPGRECEAYLVQHIVQNCLQEAWKSGKTRSTAP